MIEIGYMVVAFCFGYILDSWKKKQKEDYTLADAFCVVLISLLWICTLPLILFFAAILKMDKIVLKKGN